MKKRLICFFMYLFLISTVILFGEGADDLIPAARAGDIEKVKALIAAGADVNAIASDGDWTLSPGPPSMPPRGTDIPI